jgi:hypothetical protein
VVRFGVALAVGAILVHAPPVQAVEMRTYGKAFCKGQKVQDYERVLDRMPSVRRPPLERDLPFGPRNMSIYQSASSRVIVGRGGFGYAFFDETYGVRREVRLFWDVTATLSKISRRGQVLRQVDSTRQSFGVVRQVDDLSFWLDTPPGLALYRYDIEFRDSRSGDLLGAYSEYLRVVKPKYKVGIAAGRRVFRSGQLAFARVENRGTIWAFFGLPYGVQRYEGGGWTGVPLFVQKPGEPQVVWPAIGLIMQGGHSGWCMAYRIPADAKPGRYRFVKSIGRLDSRGRGRTYAAEFRVRR